MFRCAAWMVDAAVQAVVPMSGQERCSRRHEVVLDAPPEAKDGGRTMTEGVDDRDLIARIASGDEAAMRALFLRYRQRIAGFIRRVLNNEALVEELTNEVFLEIWRGARNFQGRSAVTTWILSIAHYRALNVLKKRGEDALDDDEAWQIPDTRDTPEMVLQKADKAEALRACAEALTPLQRALMSLGRNTKLLSLICKEKIQMTLNHFYFILFFKP